MLPAYDDAVVGVATIPGMVIDIRNGHENLVDFFTNFPYKGCFTLRSTFTVMVLSILLLDTTPNFVFLKFLSTIVTTFYGL